jgi:hypothetical protein
MAENQRNSEKIGKPVEVPIVTALPGRTTRNDCPKLPEADNSPLATRMKT